MNTERLLTIPEAAQRLNVSRGLLYRLLKVNKLPSVKLGRSRRIRESDLLQLMKTGTAA